MNAPAAVTCVKGLQIGTAFARQQAAAGTSLPVVGPEPPPATGAHPSQREPPCGPKEGKPETIFAKESGGCGIRTHENCHQF